MGSLAFYFFRFLLERIRTEKIPKRGISPLGLDFGMWTTPMVLRWWEPAGIPCRRFHLRGLRGSSLILG